VAALSRRTPIGTAAAAAVASALLALIAIPLYHLIGAAAALVLVVAGNLAIVGALVAGRLNGRQRAPDFAEHALAAVPRPLFIADTLNAGRPNAFVNAAFCKLTGYGADEATRDGFDAAAIFEDADRVRALAAELATCATSPVQLRRRDGTTVPATLELSRVGRGNADRYLIGMLEERVAGPLPHALPAGPPSGPDAAGDPPRKNVFLSWLTHELRSPLNACVMWLDVLALAPPADKLAQAVDAIKRNLARQTRLVNDLSDAAKIQSSAIDVHLEPVDFVALLKSHLDAWQLAAISKQLAFAHRIEPATALVEGDSNRLLQVLNHVVDNAIASTPAGGRVALSVQVRGAVIVVAIEDTGVGLSSEDVANLGTPLWRAPAASKSRPGLGLGLAIAHHLTTRHGGTLEAASSNAGALFTLTLPLAAGQHQDGGS
jgi:signal transduction histidine kinase